MTYREIVQYVAQESGIEPYVVDKAYRAYWKSIREHISSLPLKEELTKEDFDSLRTNFNIPSLGKLSCTYERYLRMKKKFNYIKNLRERHEKAD